MNILDVVKNRRSVRKFKNQPIADNVMKDIITAAEYAPSAGNAQDYEFLIVDDRKMMEEMAEIHPHAASLRSADKAVVVMGNLDKERFKGFWVQDCSAAAQNLLLAAYSFGIGSVWCGIYPNQEREAAFGKLLRLPDNVIPFALIPLGYPDEEPQARPRLYNDMVFYNAYGQRR